MTDDYPLVSIVLPTCNREAFLREAIHSAMMQTWPHLELNVIDDGSTDGTAAYLAACSDPRIRICSRPHDGNRARLRNLAVAPVLAAYRRARARLQGLPRA